MLRSGPLAVIAGLVLAAAGAGLLSAEDAALQRLERLGRVLRQHKVWHAEYRQEYVSPGMTLGDEEQGQVWLSWPDRVLFAAGERLMGLDGRVFRLLDHQVPSCDEHVLDDAEWARVPLAAVLDPHGAVDHFTILEEGESGVVLVPREPSGVDRVLVMLDGTGLPAEVLVIDPQGARNHFWFSDWGSAPSPPGGRWLPEPPSGVECMPVVQE